MGGSSSTGIKTVEFKEVQCEQDILFLGLDQVGKSTLMLLRSIERCPELYSDEIPQLNDSDVGWVVTSIMFPIQIWGSFWQDTYTVSTEQRKKDAKQVKSLSLFPLEEGKKVRPSKHTFRVLSWAVGGNVMMRPIYKKMCEHGKCTIFMLDIMESDQSRLDISKDELHYYLGLEELKQRPFLILLNKVDLMEDQSSEGIEEMKLRWLRILQIEETAPYDCSELASVMEVSYLAERSNRELIRSLSNEIHSLLFGLYSVNLKSMLTHSNPSLRRPIRVQPCSVQKDWDSVKVGLNWLFHMMKEVSET